MFNWTSLSLWKSEWAMLIKEVVIAFYSILKKPSGLCYLAICLGFGGAAGLWIPYYALGKTEIPADALATYVFAVIAPVLADSLDTRLGSKVEEESARAYRLLILLVSIVACSYALIALFKNTVPIEGISAGWKGVLLSVIAWVLVVSKMKFISSKSQVVISGASGPQELNADDLDGEGLN